MDGIQMNLLILNCIYNFRDDLWSTLNVVVFAFIIPEKEDKKKFSCDWVMGGFRPSEDTSTHQLR